MELEKKKISDLRDYLAGLRESKANLPPNSGSPTKRIPNEYL